MDDIAFSDWPGSPVDLSGSNPWLPAYGYQPPATLLDKDDFLGNPDAALFLQGTSDQHYIFLETIVEETSDDLRSESDRSGSRCSPVGWLATDSESGSVIHVDVEGLDDMDSGSESEMACPAKRRREDDSHLLIVPGIYSDNESIHSLSRSSSLLQFESLEKHCQDIYSSSPSILSFFSQDSLENQRQKSDVSPDSLDRCHSDSESESDYYRSLQIEVPGIRGFRNSLFYDTKRLTDSDDSNSDSRDSDDTLLVASRSNSCKSVNHALKSYRSCESLNTKGKEKVKEKMSAENLSEDSGYSDHFCNYMKKSVGVPNMQVQGIVIPKKSTYKMKNELKAPCGRNNCGSLRLKDVKISNGFDAYDYGECGFQNVASCFGSSYQDLSVFDKYESLSTFRPTVGMRRVVPRTDVLNIALECIIPSKYSMATSTSEPNLLQRDAGDPLTIEHRRCIDTNQVVCKQGFFGESVCVSSVPKDLNFVSDKNSDAFKNFTNKQTSIAAKNWDLCTLQSSAHSDRAIDKMATNVTAVFKYDESPSSSCSNIDGELTRYRREGSYVKAISDYLNMTDIPHEECILNDDPQIQKAVSDSSIRSFNNDDKIKLDVFFHSTPINKRNVTSTPNLPSIYDKNVFSSLENNELVHRSMQNVPRKSSLVDRKDDATGMKKALSTGSAKGVHFCPVVSEVSWRESSTEEEEEEASTNSAESSSTDLSVELNSHNDPVKIFTERTCVSQPELQNIEKNRETEYLFVKSDLNKSASTRSVDSNNSVENKCDVNIEINQNNQVQSCSLTEELDNPTVVNVYRPPPVGHVTARPVEPSSQQRASVAVMDSTVEQRLPTSSKPIKSVKFGSFLSRFTSFRFSGRKSSDDKTRKKSSGHDDKKKNSENSQKIATKEDYIYIPLKGPLPTDNSRKALNGAKIAKILIDGRAISEEEEPESVKCVTAKPPLPKLPPRVVSASVKRRPETAHSTPQTIDHGGGTTTAAAASIRNACSMEPMGLIETDLDTEVTVITGGSGAHVKTRSLMNLGPEPSPAHPGVRLLAGRQDSGDRPHKSMEFLLDKENLKAVEPPENELQKGTGERVMSEHQLRVQRSLQKLTIPDWYKQNQVPREGFILKKHKDTPRWTGTGTGESKTPSLSSLGSGHSPILLSPTPQIQPFTRWSTSKLNSAASSPCASTRSSFNHRTSNGGISPCSIRSSFSYRQPYLGWRSQERLTRPKTPAERLATTILPQNQENPEIQTSIKEVTSAIVHYVSALKPEHDRNSLTPKSSPRIEHKTSPKLRPHENHETGSQKSISPRGSQKLCWLESSFVGTRPLDSPETPVSLTNDTTVQQPLVPPATLRLDLQSTVNNECHEYGIPGTTSANTSPSRPTERCIDQYRRRSEGSEPAVRIEVQRRVSFHTSPSTSTTTADTVKCRYSRCGKVTTKSSDAGKQYKNCHNCTYIYCSRECRRAHWEKHRKMCLFSRVGALCRQVLAAAKENQETLKHLSLLARQGFLSQGSGAVKCFFSSPECAEKFIAGNINALGEPVYVKWADLMPSEMGPNLYSDLIKMCKTYNPDTRFVLYVSVCVVSEVPATGAVKWERQLVSRCAKIRLSKSVLETVTPTHEQKNKNMEHHKKTDLNHHSREISFAHVQKQLKQRGVSLRKQFPDVYQKLCAYVDGKSDKFSPVTIYPKDLTSGKSFMCIIMPDIIEPDKLKLKLPSDNPRTATTPDVE